MIYIIAIMLYIVLFSYILQTHLELWEQGKTINHTKWLLYRQIGFIPIVLGLLIAKGDFNLLLIIATFGLLNSVWWLLFDGLFNIKRGFNWWYNGSFGEEEVDGSWFDSLLKNLKPWQDGLIKIGLITIFLSLYLIL